MKPAAIISPMPREPPVTRAVRPFSENRSVAIAVLPSLLLEQWRGRCARSS
jgi:hypothetical protein